MGTDECPATIRGTEVEAEDFDATYWQWLESTVQLQQPPSAALLELLVDPQTCGPLLLACSSDAATQLTRSGPWIQIGSAADAHG